MVEQHGIETVLPSLGTLRRLGADVDPHAVPRDQCLGLLTTPPRLQPTRRFGAATTHPTGAARTTGPASAATTGGMKPIRTRLPGEASAPERADRIHNCLRRSGRGGWPPACDGLLDQRRKGAALQPVKQSRGIGDVDSGRSPDASHRWVSFSHLPKPARPSLAAAYRREARAGHARARHALSRAASCVLSYSAKTSRATA